MDLRRRRKRMVLAALNISTNCSARDSATQRAARQPMAGAVIMNLAGNIIAIHRRVGCFANRSHDEQKQPATAAIAYPVSYPH